METKSNQRKLINEELNKLTKEEKEEYSKKIFDRVMNLSFLKNFDTFLSFYPLENEPNVMLINDALTKMGKKVCYPVMEDGNNLSVYYPTSGEFVVGKYNVHQPDKAKSEEVDVDDVDLIFVPMVGFDCAKNRLGHGQGYYDRFLNTSSALKLGVAFDCQKLDIIVMDIFDKKLDMIVSEKDMY